MYRRAILIVSRTTLGACKYLRVSWVLGRAAWVTSFRAFPIFVSCIFYFSSLHTNATVFTAFSVYLFFFFISIPIDAESSASAVVVFLLFHSFTRLFTCVLFILFLL